MDLERVALEIMGVLSDEDTEKLLEKFSHDKHFQRRVQEVGKVLEKYLK